MSRVLAVLLICTSLFGAEIRLIYPRLEAGQDSLFYSRSLDSTFVLGHIEGFVPQMSLKCNEIPVKLSDDGAFLAFLPIPWQTETFVWNFALTNGGAETSSLSFPFFAAPADEEIAWSGYAVPLEFRVNQPNAHTRTTVGGSYHLFPDSGAVLPVTATSTYWCKFNLGGGQSGVVERRFVDSVGTNENLIQPIRVGNAEIRSNEKSTTIEFETEGWPLCEISTEPEGDEFTVRIHDAVSAIDKIRYIGAARDFIKDITWTQESGALVVSILLSESAQGYRVMTTESMLALEISSIEPAVKSLRGMRIVLDPGHGGAADGSIGPRGTKEKDAVLKWSEILEQELRSKGAEVLRTRTDDSGVGLYERIAKAREFDTDVFLSLHANALPDGENPFVRRGCGTYYYQTLSRPLAESIQSAILNKTGLSDDGIFDANFAVVRPTGFPAVLIEAAYMMHPDEELKLNDDKFLLELSRGVVNGLLDYFSKVPAR